MVHRRLPPCAIVLLPNRLIDFGVMSYLLPPPTSEPVLRDLTGLGEIPITSQHLCRGFLHGNEGHIWHHRPSFQPARPYPASRQAAGAEVSLSSSPVSWPAKQCCYLLRPSPGESLAPFGGLGALARRLFLSARMRCSSESLICNFQGSWEAWILSPHICNCKFKTGKRTFISVNYLWILVFQVIRYCVFPVR